MTAMGVNKVVFGAVSIMDISDSTVTPDKLAKDAVAYGANGERMIGTMEAGGGSSNNNCEAYHITSASQAIHPKGSGTVKVWGYGLYSQSTYQKTQYSFVGDGYYSGSSWGNPTKTSATFAIGSDGTLSGLPSTLTAVDLLVTIGI